MRRRKATAPPRRMVLDMTGTRPDFEEGDGDEHPDVVLASQLVGLLGEKSMVLVVRRTGHGCLDALGVIENLGKRKEGQRCPTRSRAKRS